MRIRATNKKWTMTLGGMVVVFVVLAGYDLIFGKALGGGPAAAPKATTSRAATVRPSTVAPVTPVAPSSSAGSPAASPARQLTVASVAAFGPEGTSDGDNPELAPRVLDGGGGGPARGTRRPSSAT